VLWRNTGLDTFSIMAPHPLLASRSRDDDGASPVIHDFGGLACLRPGFVRFRVTASASSMQRREFPLAVSRACSAACAAACNPAAVVRAVASRVSCFVQRARLRPLSLHASSSPAPAPPPPAASARRFAAPRDACEIASPVAPSASHVIRSPPFRPRPISACSAASRRL